MMFPVINIIEKKVLHNTEENLKQGVRSQHNSSTLLTRLQNISKCYGNISSAKRTPCETKLIALDYKAVFVLQ